MQLLLKQHRAWARSNLRNGTTERNHSAEYAVLDKSVGVNEMRVKILPLLCRAGLVLRLGSV